MHNPGHEIKVARLMKGMSLERLSAYSEIPVKQLILIEHDYMAASPRQLFRLATILNIPPSVLSLSMQAVESEIEEMPALEHVPADGKPIPDIDPRLILIIGQYYAGSKKVPTDFVDRQQNVSVVEVPTANKSFAMLGVGTASPEELMTPYLIILDTDIRNESYQRTTQAFHGVERLRTVPVFLTGTEPTGSLHNLSNRSNVFGQLARPETPDDYLSQLSGLLSKVDMMNSYF